MKGGCLTNKVLLQLRPTNGPPDHNTSAATSAATCVRTRVSPPVPPHGMPDPHGGNAPTLGAGRSEPPAVPRPRAADHRCDARGTPTPGERHRADATEMPLTRGTRQTAMPHTDRRAGARANAASDPTHRPAVPSKNRRDLTNKVLLQLRPNKWSSCSKLASRSVSSNLC